MICLLGLIGSYVPTALWFLASAIGSRLHKWGPLEKEEALWRLLDYSPYLSISLILGIAIDFGTGGYEDWNVFLLFIALGSLALLLRVSSIYKAIKKKEGFPLKKTIVGGLLLIYLLLEGSVFNLSSYEDMGAEEALDVSSSYVLTTQNGYIKGAAKVDGDSIDLLQDGEELNFVIELGERPAEAITLSFAEDAPSVGIKLSFWSLYDGLEATEENYGSEEAWRYTGIATWVNTKNASSLRIDLSEAYGGAPKGAVRILTETDLGRVSPPDSLILSGASTNGKEAFHFSYVRCLLVFGATLTIAYLRTILCAKRHRKLGKKPFLILLGAAAIGGAVCYILGFLFPDFFCEPYSYIEEHAADWDYTEISIYDRLLEAFNNGRFELSAYFDERLLSMDNPYDRAMRSELGIHALWDHAYYGGNYYCYYGITPLLSFIYPFFLLSGKTLVPGALLTSIYGLCFLIPAYLALLMEITRLVRGDIDWPAYIFLAAVSIFSSCLLLNVTFKEATFHEGIYRLPIVYGLLFLSLFFLFALWAYRNERYRPLYLALSGLSFVFAIMSKPTLGIGLLAALPFFFRMLIEKGRGIKKKLLDFGPMGLILIGGAIWVMYYNHARFESVFEFGQSYQINYDQTSMPLSLNKLLPSLIHFLFTPPSIQASFPFVSGTKISLSFDAEDLYYNQAYLGAFYVFFLDLAFVGPFLYWHRKKKESGKFALSPVFWASILIPIAVFVLMFVTYAKAGICMRYVLEIYFLLSIPAFGVGTSLVSYKGEEKEGALLLKGETVYVLAIFGTLVGLSLLFNSFDGLTYGDLNGLYFEFKDAFGL